MAKAHRTTVCISLVLAVGVAGCSGGDADTPRQDGAPEGVTAQAESGATGGQASTAQPVPPSPVREPAACSEAALEMSRARPLDAIGFRGTTAGDAADVDIVALIDDPAGAALELPLEVRRDQRERWSFVLPVHPLEPFAANDIQVRLRAGGETCAQWAVRILPLDRAPGTLEAVVTDTGMILDSLGQLFGVPREDLMRDDISALPAPAQAQALRMLHEAFDGEGHDKSAMAHFRRLELDHHDESAELLDAIVARSGLAEKTRSLRAELQSLAEPVAIQTSPGASSPLLWDLLGLSSAHANPHALTPLDYYQPDAATLDRWMSASRTGELAAETATAYRDWANLLITIGGTGSAIAAHGKNPSAKYFKGYFAALGAVALTLEVGGEMARHLLPSRFTNMQVQLAKDSYLEDDQNLEGRWLEARVMTRSRDWDAGKTAAQLALALGTRQRENFASRFVDDPYVREMIAGITDVLSGPWLDANLATAGDNAASIRFKARDYGPTDVSDERWTQRRQRSLTGDEVIAFTGHQDFKVVGAGRAELVISTHPELFGGRGIQRDLSVEVLPITVRIDPPSATVEPGDTVELAGTVANANDDGLQWSVEPSAHRLVVLPREGDGPQRVRVQTSAQESDFPAHVIASSTSRTGLRRSGEPPREARAAIRAGGLQIEPQDACIQPGASQRFTAFHFSDGQRKRLDAVTWQADRGRISGSGAYTAPAATGIDRIEAKEASAGGRRAVAELVVQDDCSCRWTADGGFGRHRGDTGSLQATVGTMWLGSEMSGRAPMVNIGLGPINAPGSYPLDDTHGGSGARIMIAFPSAPHHTWFSVGSTVEISKFGDDQLVGRYAGRMARLVSAEPEEWAYTEGRLEFRLRNDPGFGVLPGIWTCGPSDD